MQDLPVEVWRFILGNLSRTDICSFCLASKQLQVVVQPYLFSSVEYNWKDTGPPLGVAAIARTLHRRPDLAEAVRSVALVCITEPGYGKGSVEVKSSTDDYRDLVQAARQLKLPFALGLSKVTELGQLDAFITLLLALTPNITHLKLTEHFAVRSRMLAKLSFHAAQNQESPLRHLAHVEYMPELDLFRKAYSTNIDDVLPLFYLPSLQTLSAGMDNPDFFKWPLSEAPDLTKLTHLTLRYTRELTLSKILHQTPSLRYLDWFWRYDHDYSGYQNSPVIKLDVVGEALKPLSKTLTTLKLSGLAHGIYETPELMLKGDMRWLRGMTCMTTLETTPVFFMGFNAEDYKLPLHECLPSSLRQVRFTDDFRDHELLEWTHDDEIEVIDIWWTQKADWTPNLQEFELVYDEPDSREWPGTDGEALMTIGRRCNVAVGISKRIRR